MARISIREYEHTTHTALGLVPVGREPAVAKQAVTPAGTTARTAFGSQRRKLVRIATDVAITLNFGDSTVVAIDGDCDMPAGGVEYFGLDETITHVAYKLV